MLREIAGYLLLAALIMVILGAVIRLWYNSRERAYVRRMRSEARADREFEAGKHRDR